MKRGNSEEYSVVNVQWRKKDKKKHVQKSLWLTVAVTARKDATQRTIQIQF